MSLPGSLPPGLRGQPAGHLVQPGGNRDVPAGRAGLAGPPQGGGPEGLPPPLFPAQGAAGSPPPPRAGPAPPGGRGLPRPPPPRSTEAVAGRSARPLPSPPPGTGGGAGSRPVAPWAWQAFSRATTPHALEWEQQGGVRQLFPAV